MQQNGTFPPPFPICSHGLSKHPSDPKHEPAQWDAPRSHLSLYLPGDRYADSTQVPLKAPLCCAEMVSSWAPGNLPRVSRRPQPTLYPICCFLFGA